MIRLWTRVTFHSGGPTVGPALTPVGDVIGRLEAGESWDVVKSSTGLTAGDLVAAIAADALNRDDSPGPTLIRSPPRRPKLAHALAASALPGPASRPIKLALSAGLLQVMDFWEASHVAAQAADDLGERDFSPYWHGIAHRREPDPGNATYWFRRVGRHPLFGPLGEAATMIAGSPFRPGTWDPMAMIELCNASGRDDLARRLQRLEMLALLGATAEAAGFE